MPDTFVQDASQLWDEPGLSQEVRPCNVCGYLVEPSHDVPACIEAWGRKLAALIAEANAALRKKNEEAA